MRRPLSHDWCAAGTNRLVKTSFIKDHAERALFSTT
jgi:hypothetical protein